MSNQIFGIAVIIICCLGYFYSWKYQQKNNYKIAVALLIICGFLLRLYSASDFYLHNWDERYHALVAKNFLKHFFVPTLVDNSLFPVGIEHWDRNHIWLHKQPLPLLSMAISMWALGVNEIAVRLPSILITTIGIGLTYRISDFFFNNKIAYLSAFFYSINGLIIEMVGGHVATDHIDIFFLFFIELAIYFSVLFVQKRKTIYNVLVGVCIGAAILCKWLPALIVLPIWGLLVIDSKQYNIKNSLVQFALLCTVTIIVFLPWQLYIYKTFPLEARWEAAFNYKHITEVLQNQGGPIDYYITIIRINYGELIYFPIIWFLLQTFKKNINFKYLAICCWFIVPMVFFSFVKTKMQPYILFVSPALFMVTAAFFFTMLDYKKNIKHKWLLNIILILFIFLPFRYLIERIKPFEQRNRNPQWAIDLKKLDQKNYKKGILFNYNKPIEAMFYTNLTVYDYIPNNSTINDLINHGNTIIINDNGNVPSEIKSMKELFFENLTESVNP
jgi:4-amino-4-deoxy-L-arabinose transferase-like glycosyltransferase